MQPQNQLQRQEKGEKVQKVEKERKMLEEKGLEEMPKDLRKMQMRFWIGCSEHFENLYHC